MTLEFSYRTSPWEAFGLEGLRERPSVKGFRHILPEWAFPHLDRSLNYNHSFGPRFAYIGQGFLSDTAAIAGAILLFNHVPSLFPATHIGIVDGLAAVPTFFLEKGLVNLPILLIDNALRLKRMRASSRR